MYTILCVSFVLLLDFVFSTQLWRETGFSQVWFWWEADLLAQSFQDPGSRLAACCCLSVLLPDALCTEHPSAEMRVQRPACLPTAV